MRVFSPPKCEQMFAMLQQYSIRMLLEQQIYSYKKFVHQSIMCKVEGFAANFKVEEKQHRKIRKEIRCLEWKRLNYGTVL